MALISAMTIVRALAIFHLTLAYYFLVAPSTVTSHNMVYVLGAAMGIVCCCSSSLPPPISPLPSYKRWQLP